MKLPNPTFDLLRIIIMPVWCYAEMKMYYLEAKQSLVVEVLKSQ